MSVGRPGVAPAFQLQEAPRNANVFLSTVNTHTLDLATISIKMPILLGQDFWVFHLPKLPRYGFWPMAHEARADFDMLLGALYLLTEGAGAWSPEALLTCDGGSAYREED
jgi:hypothetical protein